MKITKDGLLNEARLFKIRHANMLKHQLVREIVKARFKTGELSKEAEQS